MPMNALSIMTRAMRATSLQAGSLSAMTLLCAAVAALPVVANAQAQAFPTKPIRVILPFGPGSISDGVTRFLAERVNKSLGTTLLIEYKAGANGSIGAREAARAAPDGYTIIVSSNSAHAANIHLYKELGYDPVKDFIPITGLTRNPHLVVVRSTLPVNNIAEFVAYGKANPGKLVWGTGNTGSLANASMLLSKAGLTGLRVNYKSQPQALTDLLAGRLDFMTIDYFNVAEHLKAGTLRAIGVTSTTRLRAVPDVPPVSDTIPGFEVIGWIAVFAPAGVPPDIVAKLNGAFTDALRSSEVVDFMEKQGMQSFPTTPAELGAFQRQQIVQWGEMLTLGGVEKE